MTNSKTAEVKARVSAEEKAQIESIAQDTGMSISDLIRTTILHKGKIIVLTEGTEITRLLGENYQKLMHCCKHKHISDKYAIILLQALEEVSELLNTVAEKLTDIHLAEEQEDD